ncbi:MAG TPA: YggT family protein [Pyrinomonadaceae bacterium]|jgi:YggT family protein|nr:YggT family protein [Pyrinomonadaceae bacterium]
MPFNQAFLSVHLIVQYFIVAAVLAVILLMLVRLALNYADLNPFSRPVMYVRRMSDPLVNPVRRSLVQFGFGPNITPLVVILISILLGWFVLQLADSILFTVAGVIAGVQSARVVAVVGYLLYGFLDVYMLLIVIRIIFSWGNVSYTNRVMRFLVNATDPVLVPMQRIVPPLGVFDISPIIALLILWLLKTAVFAVLLSF